MVPGGRGIVAWAMATGMHTGVVGAKWKHKRPAPLITRRVTPV